MTHTHTYLLSTQGGVHVFDVLDGLAEEQTTGLLLGLSEAPSLLAPSRYCFLRLLLDKRLRMHAGEGHKTKENIIRNGNRLKN